MENRLKRRSFLRGAVGGVRVFDYVVRILRDGNEVAKAVVLAPGFFLPERRSRIDGEALFGADELPMDADLRVSVTPRDCYGAEGASVVSRVALTRRE